MNNENVKKSDGVASTRSKKEIARTNYLESMDKKFDDVLMERYVPVDIYLDTDDLSVMETVNKSVKKILEASDLEIFSEPEIFKGSIIEKFWVVTKSITSNIDVIKKVSEMISSFGKSKSKSTGNKFYSKNEPAIELSEIMKNLKNVPNISVRIGSLLITKSTTRDIPIIQAKKLTREEIILIDRNPGILKNPRTLHARLHTLKQENFLNSKMAMSL